jgi:S1-C subfamily serine protease
VVISHSTTQTVLAVGTGVVYSTNGLIVANDHVITGRDDAPSQKITIATTSGSKYAATRDGGDVDTDIAVLPIGTDGLPAAVFRNDLSSVKPRDFVLAYGNPKVVGDPASTGVVTAILSGVSYKELPGVTKLLDTTVPLVEGDSGGPLVDVHGGVIGINIAQSVDDKGRIALPGDIVAKVVTNIVEKG